jgi:choline dehydrogenase
VIRPKVVVVGGGSAGLFCARALAERADVTVIEAGPDPGVPVPARYLHEHLYPEADWDYVEADRGYHLVRGRILGGSSVVNASAAVRGQPACFDAWGPGWSWDDLLPALRAVERDVQFGADPWHGDAGPVAITRLPQGPLDDAFDAAALAAGHPVCDDHNRPGALGTGPWPTNRVDGGRWGTLPALRPWLEGRVRILAGVEARRVVVRGGQASGVEVVGAGAGGATGPNASGPVTVVDADLVVLAGGAFGTPELLWRSGLAGDGVGTHLQDHPWIGLDVEADAATLAARPVSGALLRYGAGGDPREEVQIFPFSAALYEPDVPASTYRMSVGLMSPRSVGCLEPNGEGRALVHLGHLSADADLARLTDGVAHAVELLEAMAAAGHVRIPAEAWWRTTALAAAVRERVGTYNHPVGTCGIGRVVDRRLRVAGIDGLRVADASVMPVIPRANTNLASMAIGLRAGWLIAEDEGLGSGTL